MSRYIFIGFCIGILLAPTVLPFMQAHRELFGIGAVILFLFSGKIEDMWYGYK